MSETHFREAIVDARHLERDIKQFPNNLEFSILQLKRFLTIGKTSRGVADLPSLAVPQTLQCLKKHKKTSKKTLEVHTRPYRPQWACWMFTSMTHKCFVWTHTPHFSINAPHPLLSTEVEGSWFGVLFCCHKTRTPCSHDLLWIPEYPGGKCEAICL